MRGRVGGLDGCSGVPRTSPDGRFIYVSATGKGGRAGIWAIPTAGGAPRLAVSFDDQAMAGSSWLSVGPDRLYVTVSEYQSDIWVATLKY